MGPRGISSEAPEVVPNHLDKPVVLELPDDVQQSPPRATHADHPWDGPTYPDAPPVTSPKVGAGQNVAWKARSCGVITTVLLVVIAFLLGGAIGGGIGGGIAAKNQQKSRYVFRNVAIRVRMTDFDAVPLQHRRARARLPGPQLHKSLMQRVVLSRTAPSTNPIQQTRSSSLCVQQMSCPLTARISKSTTRYSTASTPVWTPAPRITRRFPGRNVWRQRG